MKKILTTPEVASATAGGVDYIRTKDNVVKGLAVRLDINPDAPNEIRVGKGPKIKARAKRFLESGRPVPLFIKLRINAWEPQGKWRATGFRPSRGITGILTLKKGLT